MNSSKDFVKCLSKCLRPTLDHRTFITISKREGGYDYYDDQDIHWTSFSQHNGAAKVIDIFHSRSPIKHKSYGTTETENDVMTSQYLVNG